MEEFLQNERIEVGNPASLRGSETTVYSENAENTLRAAEGGARELSRARKLPLSLPSVQCGSTCVRICGDQACGVCLERGEESTKGSLRGTRVMGFKPRQAT